MRNSYLLFLLSVVVMFFSCQSINAQPSRYTSTSKKAIKHFESARMFYKNKDIEDALFYLEKALDKDPSFVEVYIMKADIDRDQGNPKNALANYQKAYDVNPKKFGKLLLLMAKLELDNGWYEGANKHIVPYYDAGRFDPRMESTIKKMILVSEFGMWQLKNPVPFNPINLGKNINSPLDDYVNTLSTDEQTLIITVNLPKDANTLNQRNSFEEDFYYSKRVNDSTWAEMKDMGPVFNTNGNEGAMALSPDGRTRVYTACHRTDGLGRCDLYISDFVGEKWTPVKNIGSPINSAAWESQATLSVDGKTIFFISNRKGGKGSTDIWKSQRNDDGTWTEPTNLGEVVNSKGREVTPFIHPDGKTLYFASDGHLGMGGLDYFITRLDKNGNWSEPVNLGYPINTHLDEEGIIINANGNLAYMSSRRLGGLGKHDIYCFELYSDIRPIRVNYMKGVVRNAKTKKPVSAEFSLLDLKSGKLIVSSKSDAKTGAFFVCIPSDADFALNVEKAKYLNYSDNFSVTGGHSVLEPFTKNVNLEPIQEGAVMQLNNVFFETAKYDLRDESFIELDIVVEYLNRNPYLRMEVGGHTDNVGDDANNQVLSANRAMKVKKYLVDKGIEASRLEHRGYGETKPIDSNETEEGRQNNRRTELTIIKSKGKK